MTIRNALDLVEYYETVGCKPYPSKEEDFEYGEALRYLACNVKSNDYIYQFACYLRNHKAYDAALNYYMLIKKDKDVNVAIGDIYRDYKKDYSTAYEYYFKASMQGSLTAKYAIAKLCEKEDYSEYCHIIEELYKEIKDNNLDKQPTTLEEYENYEFIIPYVLISLGHIRKEEGNYIEAINLYIDSRNAVTYATDSDYSHSINLNKWFTQSLYELIDVNYDNITFTDLYYIFLKPVTISFERETYKSTDEDGNYIFENEGNTYYIEGYLGKDNIVHIKFNNKYYRDIEDFMIKAQKDDFLNGGSLFTKKITNIKLEDNK